MKSVESLTVFTGQEAVPVDLTAYDKVEEVCMEYESLINVVINFYKNGNIVRSMWNPSCDVGYKE